MNVTRLNVLLATLACSCLWVSSAAGACGFGPQRMPASVFTQPPLLSEESSSVQSTESASENKQDKTARSDKGPAITGLWKTVYVSGGAVINVGFNIWHSDGSEWALDSLSPPFQGNTCAGIWEQTESGKYKTIHPSYNYDAAGLNVTGVFVERLHITLHPDGNSFDGHFSFKNYDFSGKLLSGTVAGKITATRINVGDKNIPVPLK